MGEFVGWDVAVWTMTGRLVAVACIWMAILVSKFEMVATISVAYRLGVGVGGGGSVRLIVHAHPAIPRMRKNKAIRWFFMCSSKNDYDSGIIKWLGTLKNYSIGCTIEFRHKSVVHILPNKQRKGLRLNNQHR